MPTPHVIIVGAGFGGITVGLELKRAGIDTFTILESADRIGGVWRENTYPGAGCDVPSPMYSFSFASHSRWPHRYSMQADILAYLNEITARYGVDRHVRTGTRVTSAVLDAAHGRWTVTTGTGETIEADVFVPAVGQLSHPQIPRIPGLDTFAGPGFHSAEWDHTVDLAGKQVAVIGTGASTIQFVPKIQPKVQQLSLFQRTPPYVLPKPDRTYNRWHRQMFEKLPLTQTVGRAGIFAIGETLTAAIVSRPMLARALHRAALTHLRLRVRDRELRARLTATYPMGCKRVLFSNDYYPAVVQPNVDVVTAPIAEIVADGVRTTDGALHRADVIVYGTGFATNDWLLPMRVVGRDGLDLTDAWADGARAYLGMTVPEFPNMFIVYGPNTNLGGNSIIYMLERQARYIRAAVQRLSHRPGLLDLRHEVADAFDIEMQSRLAHTAWAGCANWYTDESGRIVNNWPGMVREYDRRTRAFDEESYVRTGVSATG